MSCTIVNAASTNDATLLERALLQEFGPVNRHEMDQALLRASQLGHIEIVEILLQQGACVNAEDTDGDTSLGLAAVNGHYSVVRLLLSHDSDVNWQSSRLQRTPLHLAAFAGRTIITKSLIRAGSDANLRDDNGDTALMLATKAGHEEVLKLLLKANCDIDRCNHEKETALHYAARYGHTDCLRKLLNAGANIEARNMWSHTPLISAVVRGQRECAAWLINEGSDLNVVDHAEKTPLFHAVQSNMVQCVNDLLLLGGDPERPDSDGNLPLMESVSRDNFQITRLLLQSRGYVDVVGKYTIDRDYRWVTPLEIALQQNKNLHMAALLVHAGHDIAPLRTMVCTGDLSDALACNETFLAWVEKVLSTPRNLFDLCSIRIRHHLGGRLYRKVVRVPLPRIIKEWLAFSMLPPECGE